MNKGFPKSIFSVQTLKSIAGGFMIPAEYYNGTITKRQFAALSYQELQNIWRMEEHPITEQEMTAVLGMYNKMSPFDTCFLCTRLPLRVLAKVTGLPVHAAAALKRACNYLRDMSDAEYHRRDTGKPIHEHKTTEKLVPAKSYASAVIPYEFADDKDDIVRKLRPYMSAATCKKMPTTVRMLFLATPKHVLKRLWSGKNFDKCYDQLIK